MLRDYITVYFNNILVYLILWRLRDIGLNLDLKKYTFTVKEVKYLEYIIEVGVYIRPNPKKIKAIYK
ncbi:uncharacterized protein THITE_2055898 [Thermothielavioides terrestris NRRL 8126]|uniref:Reverse transcriptase domain-containing protein n=1 Tax=Thermothielavioides terrestris (strain ATCC 38088 / NRRL 8126) TaxID=578455 RepID=G2RCF3_THETT|nr:uncharacterized protein THITE_2055898 [Thermothielavioides terrestris NRRL 8126]AEO70588.1 hypothetical protein THITE_2055898 [Thermothielavioides terrestris NRRL 8126]